MRRKLVFITAVLTVLIMMFAMVPTIALAQDPFATDIEITKSDDPDPVVAGENLVYEITIRNLGPGSATGVNVTDILPPGAIFQWVIPNIGSASESGGIVTWNVGDLLWGGSANLSIGITTPVISGTITNSAEVIATEDDLNPNNNAVSEDTTILPPLPSGGGGSGNGDGEPVEVGGDIFPGNKFAMLAPWLVLAVALIIGTTIVIRRRRVSG
jgi:uncharacterized repeat protein (TIGR01451 family)